MRVLRVAILLVVVGAGAACDTAVDNTVGPDPMPDAGPVEGTFENVNNVFVRRCSGPVCHVDTPTPASGLDLSADVLCANVIGVESNDSNSPGDILVVPGDPDSSYLLCKMLDDCEATGGLMPLGAARQIPDVATIRAWIADGAPGCPAP